MKLERPQFELTRVFSDGSKEAPEIVPVTQLPWDTQMNRRGFLGVGVGTVAVLGLLDANSQAADFSGYSEWQSQSAAAPVKVPEETILAHEMVVNGLAVTPDGKTLVSTSTDSTIKLWSLPNGRFLLRRKVSEEFSITSLAIAANGKMLVTGLDNNTTRVWSLPGGVLLGSIRGHEEPVQAVAVTPNGKIVATGDIFGALKIWSWPARKLLVKLEGNQRSVALLAVTPDGTTLISGDGKGTIRLWSLEDWKLMNSFGDEGSLNAFAVSADGRILISASGNKEISLWSLPDGKPLKTLRQPKASGPQSLALSPDGRTLISGWSDDKIRLWSLPEGKLVETLEGHRHNVSALAVTPDGKWLISGDDGGIILIWDLENRSFRSFLFDRAANDRDVKGVSYNVYDKLTGQTITYTLPCGSPIPRGAVCTCNCVRGSYVEPYSGGGGGTYCTCNKICTCIPISDRNAKEAFETTDPQVILQRLSELPIQTWNYKWDDASVRHIGPMAQDFAAAFAVGEDNKHIHPLDAQGVAFAAIQALHQIVKEKDVRLESLQVQLQTQQAENQELKARLESLESLINRAT